MTVINPNNLYQFCIKLRQINPVEIDMSISTVRDKAHLHRETVLVVRVISFGVFSLPTLFFVSFVTFAVFLPLCRDAIIKSGTLRERVSTASLW
jgi:hypothetical protein